MKFGFFLPMSGALAEVKNIIEASKEAESLGYDSVWVYDMSLTQTRDNYRNNLVCGSWEDIDPNGDPNFVEPFTTLSALAVSTDSIRLGSAVIQLPLYNPIVVARQAANIDVLSGGRLNLGIGIGGAISFFRPGFEHIHFPFPKRGKIFDEYARVIRQLWSSKSPSSFEGKYIQFSDLELFPKPVSAKLLIGSGVAEKGLRRVIEFGDGVIFPYSTPSEIRANVVKIKEEANRHERSLDQFEMAQTIFTCMGRTDEEARNLLIPTIRTHAAGFGGKAMSTDEHARHSNHQISTDHLMEMSLVGRPEEIVKGLEKFEAAGLQHAILALIFRGKDLDSFKAAVRNFAKDIVPSFNRS